MSSEMTEDYLIDDDNVTVIVKTDDGTEIYTTPTIAVAEYLESVTTTKENVE